MRLAWGNESLDLSLTPHRLVRAERGPMPPALTDIESALSECLEHPFQYPSLRRALTPEDHVVIVVDPDAPRVGRLLPPLLKHLTEARIDPSAITLVCPRPGQDQSWVDELPDEFQEVQIEAHRSDVRKHLAYLATTQGGRRVYLNRRVVDADQIVVLTRRGYLSRGGFTGGAATLYPALSDEETLKEATPGQSDRPSDASVMLRKEAGEVAWLLGAPFFVQVIEGEGDDLIHLIGGAAESCEEGERLLDDAWRVRMDELADVVIATVGGDPAKQTFADLARALQRASRAAKPEGRVILVAESSPELGPAATILREEDESPIARQRLFAEKPVDAEAALAWLTATDRVKTYVLSRIESEVLEEMFVTPLDKLSQIKRLIGDSAKCLVLPDAHRTRVVTRKSTPAMARE